MVPQRPYEAASLALVKAIQRYSALERDCGQALEEGAGELSRVVLQTPEDGAFDFDEMETLFEHQDLVMGPGVRRLPVAAYAINIEASKGGRGRECFQAYFFSARVGWRYGVFSRSLASELPLLAGHGSMRRGMGCDTCCGLN